MEIRDCLQNKYEGYWIIFEAYLGTNVSAKLTGKLISFSVSAAISAF